MSILSNRSGKLPILVIIILGVVLVGGLATVKFMKGGKHAKVEKKVDLQVWKLKEFTVNLADREENHYLKVDIVLEIEGKLAEGGEGEGAGQSPEEVKACDAIISTLTKKTFAQLLTETGKEQLKKDLITGLNGTLEGIKVHNIYFTSFAMQ